MKRAIIATMAMVLVASACQPSSSNRLAGTPTASVGPTATATAVQAEWGPPEKPAPVVFARGETVSRGDLSLFFLDPATGVTEGWGTSADGRCAVRGVSGDERMLLFDCKRPPGAATPSSPPATDTYALDLWSGAWTLVPQRPAPYGIVAPNGDPLTAAAFEALHTVLTTAPMFEMVFEAWSPDSSAFVASVHRKGPPDADVNDYLIRMDSRVPVHLADGGASIVWANDGSKLAFLDCCHDRQSVTGTVTVFDGSGRKLWERNLTIGQTSNPRWSPDSTLLGIQVTRQDTSQADYPIGDLDVLDGATGDFAFRLRDALACEGRYWTADGRLLVDSWRDQVLVDPRSRSLLSLREYVTPSPTDPNLGISFDGSDFYTVDLKDDSKRLLAHTTMSPAWGGLIADGRIMFRPGPVGGHGGCEEGIGVPQNSRPHLQFPPFPGG